MPSSTPLLAPLPPPQRYFEFLEWIEKAFLLKPQKGKEGRGEGEEGMLRGEWCEISSR